MAIDMVTAASRVAASSKRQDRTNCSTNRATCSGLARELARASEGVLALDVLGKLVAEFVGNSSDRCFTAILLGAEGTCHVAERVARACGDGFSECAENSERRI